MNMNDLTIGQVKELAAIFCNDKLSSAQPSLSGYPVGENVIVRTVTMIYTGKLIDVTPTDLILVDCSWIPETDRFMQFVANGSVKECEPYPDGLPVFINRGALLDLCELRKDLPRSQ